MGQTRARPSRQGGLTGFCAAGVALAASIAPQSAPEPAAGKRVLPPHAQVIGLGISIWASRAVYAAAALRLADHLADGARSAADLASATATHAPSLYRLLRALASLGLVTEVVPKRFALTTLGATLRTGAPGAARATIMTLAGDWQWKAWGEFLHCLRTGDPAVEKVWGAPLFDYLAREPVHAADFSEAMVGRHGHQPAAIAAAYDFSGLKMLVDVGGGIGNLLTTILLANAQLNGILYDLPHVIGEAGKFVAGRGLGYRCKLEAGDFFNQIPAGHDGYVLSHVLHDWDDGKSVAILRNCRRAIAKDGRLLIVEIVLPEGDAPHEGKILDLLMLTVTGGVERTAEEFGKLLSGSGFRLTRILPTATEQSIIEAEPV